MSPLVRPDRPGTALLTGAARGIGPAIASRLLAADDVADAALRVVRERWRLLRSPHRPVGRQPRLLTAASAVSPDRAQRLVVKRVAG